MRALVAAFVLLLAACATTGPTPEGFAPYKGSPTRAVSPDGVLFKASVIDNEPVADLAFWAEALRRRQENAGYNVISETIIKADGLDGSLLELETPWGAADYTYLIAIFVDGADLHVVEAAGDVTHIEAHRASLLAAIESTIEER